MMRKSLEEFEASINVTFEVLKEVWFLQFI